MLIVADHKDTCCSQNGQYLKERYRVGGKPPIPVGSSTLRDNLVARGTAKVLTPHIPCKLVEKSFRQRCLLLPIPSRCRVEQRTSREKRLQR